MKVSFLEQHFAPVAKIDGSHEDMNDHIISRDGSQLPLVIAAAPFERPPLRPSSVFDSAFRQFPVRLRFEFEYRMLIKGSN